MDDQFGTLTVDLKKPFMLCRPADKNFEDPDALVFPDDLMCYKSRSTPRRPAAASFRGPIFIHNQFEQQTIELTRAQEFCVPSQVMDP